MKNQKRIQGYGKQDHTPFLSSLCPLAIARSSFLFFPTTWDMSWEKEIDMFHRLLTLLKLTSRKKIHFDGEDIPEEGSVGS